MNLRLTLEQVKAELEEHIKRCKISTLTVQCIDNSKLRIVDEDWQTIDLNIEQTLLLLREIESDCTYQEFIDCIIDNVDQPVVLYEKLNSNSNKTITAIFDDVDDAAKLVVALKKEWLVNFWNCITQQKNIVTIVNADWIDDLDMVWQCISDNAILDNVVKLQCDIPTPNRVVSFVYQR